MLWCVVDVPLSSVPRAVANEIEQNDAQPGLELYASERVKWVPAINGAAQKQGMPDSGDA